MNNRGSAKAAWLSLGLMVVLGATIFRVVRLRAEQAMEQIAPSLVFRLEAMLKREVRIAELDYRRPGLLIAKRITVSRGRTFADGTLLKIDRLVARYDPTLASIQRWVPPLPALQARARVRLEGVTAWYPAPLPGRKLFSASAAETTIDLGALTREGVEVASAVGDIIVDQPALEIERRAGGGWSFDPLLRLLRSKKPSAYRGAVRLRGGTVAFTDARAVGFATAQRNVARGDLELQFSAYPRIGFGSEVIVEGPHGGPLAVEGFQQAATSRWYARVAGRSNDLAYWYRYWVRPSDAFGVDSGRGEIELSAWGGGQGPSPGVGFSLGVRAPSGVIHTKSIRSPIQIADAVVNIDPVLVSFDGRAAAGGVRTTVGGEWIRGAVLADSRLRLRLSSRRFEQTALQALVPEVTLPEALKLDLAESVSCRIDVVGSRLVVDGRGAFPGGRFDEALLGPGSAAFHLVKSDRVDIAGNVRVRSAKWMGAAAESLSGEFHVRDRLVYLRGRARGLGGEFSLAGRVDTATTPGVLDLSGSARDLLLERVPQLPERLIASGRFGGDFRITGTQTDWAFDGQVESPAVVASSELLTDLTARLGWDGKSLRVSRGALRWGDVPVQASVQVDRDGPLDLHLSAGPVDLATLPERIRPPGSELTGSGLLSAHVGGTIEAPDVDGRFDAYHLSVAGRWLDYAGGEFSWAAKRSLLITNGRLIRDPLQAVIPSMTITTLDSKDRPVAVHGSASVTGGSVGQLLRLADRDDSPRELPPLSGDLSQVEVRWSGTLADAQIDFDIDSPRVAAYREDLGPVRVAGHWDAGKQILRDLTATAETPLGDLKVDGSVAWVPASTPRPAGTVETRDEWAESLRPQLRIRGEGLRATSLVQRYATELAEYATVEVKGLGIELHVSGSGAAPRVHGIVSTADVLVNGRAVPVRDLQVAWRPEGMALGGLDVPLGSGRLRSQAFAIRTAGMSAQSEWTEQVFGELRFEEVPAGVLRQLVEDSPWYESGGAVGIREALAQWTQPLDGTLTAAMGSTGLTGGSVPGAATRLLDDCLAGNVTRAFSGTVRITDLSLLGSVDAPESDLESEFSYDAKRLEVSRAVLRRTQPVEGGGSRSSALAVSGAWDRNKPGGGETLFKIEAKNLDIDALVSLPIRGLRRRLLQFAPLGGQLSGSASVQGTAEKPGLLADLRIDRPVIGGLPFAAAVLNGLSYSAATGQLVFRQARLDRTTSELSPQSLLTASGVIALPWQDGTWPPTGPRTVTITVPRQSLANLTALANEADELAAATQGQASRLRPLTEALSRLAPTGGDFGGQIVLGGTQQDPRNSGYFEAQAERIRDQGLDTELLNFDARIDLDRDRIDVTRFTATGSRGGRLTLRGHARLLSAPNGQIVPSLQLELDVDQLKFSERRISRLVGDEFKGTQAEGTLQTVDPARPGTSSPVLIEGDWPSPRIAGGIVFDNANLLLAFQSITGSQARSFPSDARLQLSLIAGKTLWLRNPIARLRLSGALNAGGTLRLPSLAGELRVIDGSFTLAALRLRNAAGMLQVAYDASKLDPDFPSPSPVSVNIEASTSLSIRRTALSESEYVDAVFQIRGTPDGGGETSIRGSAAGSGLSLGSAQGLSVTVRTDPPLPSRDIESLIRQQLGAEGIAGGGTNVAENLQSQFEQALTANLATAITGRIEDFVQAAFGLDVFSLDVGVYQPLRVRLGKRLVNQLYVVLSQEFGSTTAPEQRSLEVYYKLTPLLRIGYRQEQPFNRRVFFFSGTRPF